jgi:hypothetical protein
MRVFSCFALTLVLSCGGSGSETSSSDSGSTSDSTAGTSGPTSSSGDGDSGDGDASSTGDGDAGSTGDGDGDTCAGECVEVPAGWEGPVVVSVGSPGTPLDCSPGTSIFHDGSIGPTPTGSVECDACSCDESGVVCGDITVNLFDDIICASQCGSVSLSHGVCTPVPAACSGSITRMAYGPQPGWVSGQCAPVPAVQQPVLPSVEWTQSARACEGSPAGSCGVGSCFEPVAGWWGPCISTVGDVACPAEFPTKVTAYDDYDDTRGCTECQCGSPADPCPLVVQLMDSSCSLDGPESRGLDANSCQFGDGTPQDALRFGAWESCGVSGGEPEGEVVGTGARTHCCVL